MIAGRRVGSPQIFDLQEEPGSQEDEPALDIMAFPENIFAGILESLPPEQLLNVSRVRLLSHAPSSSTFLSKLTGCWFCASSPESAIPLHLCTGEMEPTEDSPFVQVSKQFAQVSEVALEKACRTHRWSLPRFPRGAAASTLFPWRALYR